MRSTKPGSARSDSTGSREAEPSQENFGISALTRCLVDADTSATSGAGRARRKALGVSALVQFCTLTAILIVPLFATGTRLILRPTNFVPLPPYGGAPRHDAGPVRTQPARTSQTPIIPVLRDQIQSPTRPHPIANSVAEEDPKLGPATTSRSDSVPGAGSGGRPNILIGDGPGPQPLRPDPAPAPPSRKPVSVSQGVELARLIHRVEPVYPNFARQTHREGTVELRATISSEGVVKDLQVLSGDPVLAHAAREAVAQWRFRPTVLNGAAVEVVTFITVNFHIG